MISRLSLFRGSVQRLQTRVKINTTPKIYVQSKVLNTHKGYFVRDLVNDIKSDEDPKDYKARSWNEFLGKLVPNTYYVYLHKTRIVAHPIKPERKVIQEPGHIAGFLTDANGAIMEHSVMSLRNDPDEKIKDKDGRFLRIKGEVEGSMQPLQFVYKIKFLKIDIELKEYFFKYHTTDIPNLRYLIGIPTVEQEQIDEILNSVAKTKIDLENENYKLFDGTINGKEARAINCVNGFYLSNNVIGVVRTLNHN
jgi:hypothetical protein